MPPPPDPQDGPYVGTPCPLDACAWHRQELERALRTPQAQEASTLAKVTYHRRWLEHLLRPTDPDAMPRVSVVIPAFNRARMAAEAVAGALAQSHPRMEVIVVDDGSTDELSSALAPQRHRITLLQQENRGVSSARNRGLQAATGDFLLFLDSDDRLEPRAIEHLLGGFRAIADAELCCAAPRHCSSDGDGDPIASLPYRPEYLEPLRGDPDCPSRDLMGVMCRCHPFLLLGVLMPRWLVLELGGFDERLRRGEDTRFLFRLGMRGTKVIGLRRRLSCKRLLRTGLSSTQQPAGYATTRLMNLVDLIERPALWPHVPTLLHRLSDPALWRCLEQPDPSPLLAQHRSLLLHRLPSLLSLPSPLSPTPLLLAFQQLAAALLSSLSCPAPFTRQLLHLSSHLLRHSPHPSHADLRLWLPLLPPSPASPLALLTLSLIERGHWWHASSPPQPFWRDLDRAIDSLLPQTASPLPAGPHTSNAPLPPLPFFRRALHSVCLSPHASPALLAHHAAWLLALLTRQSGPLVSVVLPVFNSADSIADAVDSVLHQTYTPLELLLIDDGSTDHLLEVLRPQAHRLRLLRQSHKGPHAARQLAIRLARGPLLLFLQPHQRLEPHAIEHLVHDRRSHPDAQAVAEAEPLQGATAQQGGVVFQLLPRHMLPLSGPLPP